MLSFCHVQKLGPCESPYKQNLVTFLKPDRITTSRMMYRAFTPLPSMTYAQGSHRDYLIMYLRSLEYGVRFPFSPFITEVMREYNFSPNQLLPNSWLLLTCFQYLCDQSSVVPPSYLFGYFYFIISKNCFSNFVMRNPDL